MATTSQAPVSSPADAAPPTSTPTPTGGVTLDPSWIRNLIGLAVITVGMGGIIAVSLVGLQGNFDKVFTTFIAVAGGWVSTILVFYFSRENFQAAQQEVSRAVTSAVQSNQSSSGPVASAAVKTAMIPLEKLMPLKLAKRAEGDVPVKELCDLFTQNPTLTRAPVLLDDGSVKYVIHDASFYRFMSDRNIRGLPVQLPAADGKIQTKLSEFLDHDLNNPPDITTPKPKLLLRDVVSVFATCTPTTTLGDAQAAMVAQAAQDVVVTQDGKASSPLIGLITTEGLGRSAAM